MLPTYAMNVIIVKNHLTILCVLNEKQENPGSYYH